MPDQPWGARLLIALAERLLDVAQPVHALAGLLLERARRSLVDDGGR